MEDKFHATRRFWGYMKKTRRNFSRLWNRFDKLVAMSEADRRRSFHYDGKVFLARLMEETMRDYDGLGLTTSTEFSAFLVHLRTNYREWNQNLMGLMIAFENSAPASREALVAYAATCPWKMLAEEAHHYADSKAP